MKYTLIAVVSLIFLSCSKSKVPDGILKPEKMQAVFWDYIRADVFANEYVRRDTAKNPTIMSGGIVKTLEIRKSFR